MKTDTDTNATATVLIAVVLFVIAMMFFIATFFAGSHKASEVTLPDGRHVACVKTHAGGVTCDWGNAK